MRFFGLDLLMVLPIVIMHGDTTSYSQGITQEGISPSAYPPTQRSRPDGGRGQACQIPYRRVLRSTHPGRAQLLGVQMSSGFTQEGDILSQPSRSCKKERGFPCIVA